MKDFQDFNLKSPLRSALDDLGFSGPTPIQKESFSPILSGRNVVGIAQTGTGKTLAYMLPLLRELRYDKSPHPRILVIVPTRELVLQVVEQIELFAKYMDLRIVGVYGGTNIQTQKLSLVEGVDILVATPGRLYDLALTAAPELGVIHSNKTQNYRIRSIKQFEEGVNRILIATDIMARGLDLTDISHVINMDVPTFPENYMHRIGRTGRAESMGHAILLYTEKEREAKDQIEALMSYQIPEQAFPEEVAINHELTPEERSGRIKSKNHNRNAGKDLSGPAFHEKKDKNKKVNLGGKYHREIKKKYKKPKTKGDKHRNRRK
ncbi:UNVERIFIED_CONTAM: hypothetical protein GTU68_057685 [Idotea baltica]|nr:hypothetical protein [Idotea baltica]